MIAVISLKHPSRQAGGMRGLSCSVLTSSPQKTPDYLARHAMQWQPGKGIRGAHGHGAPRSAILPLGCHGEAHVDLDAAVPIRSIGEDYPVLARKRGVVDSTCPVGRESGSALVREKPMPIDPRSSGKLSLRLSIVGFLVRLDEDADFSQEQ